MPSLSHYSGWKHRENVKLYYQGHFPQWAMEQQARQMQDPQYAAMMASGFMPPFGMMPDGTGNDMLMQQQMQMQMQQQMAMQQQLQMQQMPQQIPQGMPPPAFNPVVGAPPVFRPPPSMGPPPSFA